MHECKHVTNTSNPFVSHTACQSISATIFQTRIGRLCKSLLFIVSSLARSHEVFDITSTTGTTLLTNVIAPNLSYTGLTTNAQWTVKYFSFSLR